MNETVSLDGQEVRKQAAQASRFIKKSIRLLNEVSRRGVEPARSAGIVRAVREIETGFESGSLAAFEKEMKAWLGPVKSLAEEAWAEYRRRLGADLERLLREKTGLALAGNYPDLTAGPFGIRFEEKGARLFYGADEEPLGTLPAEPEAIAEEIAAWKQELESSRGDEAEFLRKLLAAWRKAVLGAALPEGSRVPIPSVLGELAWLMQSKKFLIDPRRSGFREYTRVHLSYHLGALQRREIDGLWLELSVATREQVKRRELHLWVPRDGSIQGTHFADLSFQAVPKRAEPLPDSKNSPSGEEKL